MAARLVWGQEERFKSGVFHHYNFTKGGEYNEEPEDYRHGLNKHIDSGESPE